MSLIPYLTLISLMASLASALNTLSILSCTDFISACGEITTNVVRKELNQLSLLLSSTADTFNGNTTSNLIDEFCGQFFATPVTVKGTNMPSFFIDIVLPT